MKHFLFRKNFIHKTIPMIHQKSMPTTFQTTMAFCIKILVILDTSRHMFLYGQPRPMEQGEIRTRRSRVKLEGVAAKQVITFTIRKVWVGKAFSQSRD